MTDDKDAKNQQSGSTQPGQDTSRGSSDQDQKGNAGQASQQTPRKEVHTDEQKQGTEKTGTK